MAQRVVDADVLSKSGPPQDGTRLEARRASHPARGLAQRGSTGNCESRREPPDVASHPRSGIGRELRVDATRPTQAIVNLDDGHRRSRRPLPTRNCSGFAMTSKEAVASSPRRRGSSGFTDTRRLWIPAWPFLETSPFGLVFAGMTEAVASRQRNSIRPHV